MKKSAVVYDKWLSSLGGGEVVACNIARILADEGYDVIFIAGKKVDKQIIKDRLNIDFANISLIEIWTDEARIKKISKDKDLFVNVSFIDYTYGTAKKNIYYTLFPKEPYGSVREMLFTKLLFPFITKFINPVEMISDLEITTISKSANESEAAYLLKEKNKIAIPYLQKNKTRTVEFSLFFNNFSQTTMKALKIKFENAEILDKKFYIDHHHNQMNVKLMIKPLGATAYLEIKITKSKFLTKADSIFLLYPKTRISSKYETIFKYIYSRLSSKLRTGIFINPLERLKSYKIILADSLFTKKWIKNYWKRESVLLYPPVELLFHTYKVENFQKKKWICSVGRFFRLGHGKKQEILIEAFKKFYDSGYSDWELHLCGGVGSEESSMKFLEKLKNDVNGYPVFFHLNVPRKEIEKILLSSKIYWHATGYGENENRDPIKFEHFGIAPIEAMSAGCIPVLFDGGGLRETIFGVGFNNKNLFKSIDQLVNNTIYHVKNREKINWKQIFENINSKFSLEAFKQNFLKIINER